MNSLNLPFSVVGLLAFIYLLYIFATLSRRLGAITKMKSYYRRFYVAMGLVAVAIITAMTRQPDAESNLVLHIIAYYLPLTLAGIISLDAAYRYWGWLFRDQERMQ